MLPSAMRLDRHRRRALALGLALLAGSLAPAAQQPPAATSSAEPPPAAAPLEVFAAATAASDRDARQALDVLAASWQPGYAVMLLELAELSREPEPPPPDPAPGFPPLIDAPDADRPQGRAFESVPPPPPRPSGRERLLRFLERQTGQRFGRDFERWHQWLWARPYEPHPDYMLFKGLLYANIDPRMREFFQPGSPASIRLDEIEWGGVRVNGIPPLYYPARLAASDAGYLADDHIVFGLAVNGEARAYPKRILAWHELAWDRVGGVELTIVYCTLCGTVIPYESTAGGIRHRLGTSGLLYRSNKLMFDEATRSLWSTLEGRPVVGPLVGSGLELRPRAIVTTSWGEWRRRHPETTVLSLETGHERDYSEGAAYRAYFSTDRLMFPVPSSDRRLRNKDEVLVLRVEPPDGGEPVPLAIAADFLARRPVYHTEAAGRRLVVVTTPRGANRAYDAGDRRFEPAGRSPDLVVDQTGARWRVTEAALEPEAGAGEPRPRVPAQRAFWFGWHAQYPGTILIK